MITRIPIRVLPNSLSAKTKRQPYAAVRGRITGQRPTVQRDAVPGDAMHVRHMGIVVHVRAVVLFLLHHGKDAGRRLAFLDAGRHRRAQDPAVGGVVERDLLRLDRDDRHDGSPASAPRRRRLFRRWRRSAAWVMARVAPAARQLRPSVLSVRPSRRAPRWCIAPPQIDLPCRARWIRTVRACGHRRSGRIPPADGTGLLVAAGPIQP